MGDGKIGESQMAVHAQPLQVIEPPSDAGQVVDAVPVRILEGAWIDLVDDRGAPPGSAPEARHGMTR
jgi:hypothetical protein